ncbi:MAG TPA: hypothetical protein VFK28_09240 [Sphingomicrobium sp.]|nr:hypothetical protein [Sphingomicrobium sp.]
MFAMLLIAAAAAVAAPQPPSSRPAPAVAQATATVRIVSGVRLKLDSPTNPGAPPAHDSKVMTEQGKRPARLIEFQ